MGRQLAERYSRERAPLLEQLEAVKFVCKEFWGEVFRKVVDNLRTNHRQAAGAAPGAAGGVCMAGGAICGGRKHGGGGRALRTAPPSPCRGEPRRA